MVGFIVAQVKKDEIRDRILKAAEKLFSDHGYAATTMTTIAVSADMSKSNIYVYFPSKLDILWAISDPWLRERFAHLEDELSNFPKPEDRVRHIFTTLWCDLPTDRNGFANNMMQALSTDGDSEGYSRELLAFSQVRLSALLAQNLTMTPHEIQTLAHITMMAFDGFAIGQQLGSTRGDTIRMARAFADITLKHHRTAARD